MFDHIGIKVSNFEKARRFFDAVLKPLGRSRCYSDDTLAGYGSNDQPVFWLHASGNAPSQVHVAFAAPDNAAVQAFHAAGISAGGKDNGPPGPRPDYGPNYFAAFLVDADGNNLEAVCTRETA